MVTYVERVEAARRTDDDGVFRALADPTRRGLLDALFASDGQTVTSLCARFPEMTRFGVSKHLKVLEEAGLVTSTRVGRTRLHFLNPVPIAQIAHRWIDKYAAPYASALVELEQQATRSAPPAPPRHHPET
jgi:DNA-binding transcriptional ArsR family regulator